MQLNILPIKKEIIIRAEKNIDSAIVSVIDFGIGMLNSDQDMVFERFYRANDHESTMPGLGMGLYISSEIIKEHNGEINVRSKLNEGSVFSFSLPLATKQINTCDVETKKTWPSVKDVAIFLCYFCVIINSKIFWFNFWNPLIL